MSVLLSHTTVAPFVQQAARALNEAGLLACFHTTLADRPKALVQRTACALARLAGRDLAADLRRRAVTEVPAALVHTHAFRELLRLASGPLDRSGRLTDLVWAWAEPAFDRAVSRSLPPGLRAVYGYEYSSLATFREARRRGLRVFYDLPAPEPLQVSRLLAAEIEKFSTLDSAYQRHTRPREQARLARRRAEWDCADFRICASEVTRQSFARAGFDVSTTHVIPYGAPPVCEESLTLRPRAPEGPLRLVWAGTFGLRKGAHYLIDAWRRLAPAPQAACLKVYGANALPPALAAKLPPGIELCGSVSREALLQVFRDSDLLVFPTLCDGFGLVATEAWSQGLPVLTTANAGASLLARDKDNGLLIPPFDSEALAGALHWCLENRQALADMRRAALQTAAGWQWSDYRSALAALVLEKLGTHDA